MHWRHYGLVAALGLLTPIVLALILFPTPMSDTREATPDWTEAAKAAPEKAAAKKSGSKSGNGKKAPDPSLN